MLLVLKQREEKPRKGARRTAAQRRSSLLVAPASLLSNWQSEIERFAPALTTLIVHPSAMPAADIAALDAPALASPDLIITSYAMILRSPVLASTSWDLLIADEAQAIKNPAAKQTRALKAIPARARITLTGTSIGDAVSDGRCGERTGMALGARILSSRRRDPTSC
jgi:non-specific serine/threonine protein kinase